MISISISPTLTTTTELFNVMKQFDIETKEFIASAEMSLSFKDKNKPEYHGRTSTVKFTCEELYSFSDDIIDLIEKELYAVVRDYTNSVGKQTLKRLYPEWIKGLDIKEVTVSVKMETEDNEKISIFTKLTEEVFIEYSSTIEE